MVLIELLEPHWSHGIAEVADLCLHGGVRVTVESKLLLTGAYREWCVSAAALYLLRTLEEDHRLPTPRVPEQPWGPLIPCCGHALYANGERSVTILGCPNGDDLEVIHAGDRVRLRNTDDESASATAADWRDAVLSFASSVEAVYASAAPKRLTEEDLDG